MPFTSYAFLFLFLPVTLSVYHLLPARYRAFWIACCSWVFYAAWDPLILSLLLAVTGIAYLTGRLLAHRRQRTILVLGVGINLFLLAYFKYANFGIESLNALLREFHLSEIGTLNLLLPIGLSFFVFNSISYMVDIYRKEARCETDFFVFSTYLSAFSHVLNGPIMRFKQHAAMFRSPEPSWANFEMGAIRFMVGMQKKILLADPLSPLVQASFTTAHPTAPDVWLGMVAYSLQLYFDFSGYSDMAIGLGRMLGYTYPENFNHPYMAQSITQFWQRWHLSLSGFLKNYLYIPLGGNRKGNTRTYINLFLTMTLGGLWHGANWTFVLWGMWNGFFLMLERYLNETFKRPPPPILYALPKMMVLVMLGRLFFRSDTVSDALQMFWGSVGRYGWSSLSPAVSLTLTPERGILLCVSAAMIGVAPLWNRYAQAIPVGAHTLSRGLLVLLFVVSLGMIGVQAFTPFLYFRF